ncbi:MAG: NUDIX hydrolase [Caldilineaceae bacterium]|nr:NUDIX hydrolase [Caldilineaceae bacterium]
MSNHLPSSLPHDKHPRLDKMPARIAQSLRRPMIDEVEVRELAEQFGEPARRTFVIQADEYIYSYRWRKDLDRRAEVVFAIQDPSERIWLHAKPHYPAHIFRLPSGGVHWDEDVEGALWREVSEETGLMVQVECFLGLIEYRFQHHESIVSFASYVFHLSSSGGWPKPNEDETISEFRALRLSQIGQISVDLRNLIGNRRGWGQWRALAHDLVVEHLTK